MAIKDAYITLKDHKEDFSRNLPCRLINPAKPEVGKISKAILDRVLSEIRPHLRINAWKNTTSVIDWFNNIHDKQRCSFTSFDIVDFYPSITEDLLREALNFAGRITTIKPHEEEIIFLARKSLLFGKNREWVKRGHGLFDVTMGCFDGAEVCELVGAFALSQLTKIFNKQEVGLYRDDGLAVFRDVSGHDADKIRKDITRVFQELGLKITIQTKLKTVDFLDVTLNLATGKHYPYRKPNDRPMYVHSNSNHPPSIIKNLPSAISRRLTDISSNNDIFDQAAPLYNDALRNSGHTEPVEYLENRKTSQRRKRKNRRRNIIWFNPPFSRNVSTNLGQRFFRLINKHFPNGSCLHKIFNQNTIKLSYSSCMPNMSSIIKRHNNEILKPTTMDTTTRQDNCNCRDKGACPLEKNCLIKSVVYKATVATANGEKEYTGLTENTFKQRYGSHKSSFNNRKLQTSTELSKYIWTLKDSNTPFVIKWRVHRRAAAYSNKSKRCNLCLAEKLAIAECDKHGSLNKRSELVSKCRHENKFYLSNFIPKITARTASVRMEALNCHPFVQTEGSPF